MAVPETPITRLEQYWAAILDKIQGGGSSVTIEPLTVTENGTTTAPSGKAYSPVTANVPNSYGASDEGKVVSNGALVAQTAHAPVTTNGTIDTTLYNSVPVNVPNPNYVETITGTMANPWGSVDTNELATEIATFGANAMLNWDATAIGFGADCAPVYLSDSGSILLVRSAHIGSESDYQAVSIEWMVTDGVIQLANALTDTDGFVGLMQYATLITTTLTIIHHPLPDNE